MTPADLRRIALSFKGVEEVSHTGLPAFRVGGRRFASLASQGEGYGNLTVCGSRRTLSSRGAGRARDRSGLKFGIPRDEQKITSSCILARFSPVF